MSEAAVPDIQTLQDELYFNSGQNATGLLRLLRDAFATNSGKVGGALVAFVVAVAAFGPFFAPHSATAFVTTPFAPPAAGTRLGGDVLGRDVLSRLLDGGWELLLMAAAATALGIALGAALGIVAAFRGGIWDALPMRASDVLLAFPQIILALLLLSVVGPKLWLV